ncbi:MAG: hypothetical protein WCL23_03595 [Candidatus Moraniibacteriota bacterium]
MMYWIFFILFILASVTPASVQGSLFGFSEETAEGIIIFLLGATGFLIFFLKEKSLLRQVREKLLLQRQKSDITKDLSDSYSYIGESNRKLDLVQSFIFSIPDASASFRRGVPDRVYKAFSKTVQPFCKSESFTIRIVDLESKTIVKDIRSGRTRSCAPFSVERLIELKKSVNEEDGCVVVRSPKRIGHFVAFLLFSKVVNDIADERMLETIATEGLILYSLEKRLLEGTHAPEKTKAL